MAPYHSWCPQPVPNVTTRCGFVGVQLRSPLYHMPNNVTAAVVHVTGLGMYELYLNGKKLGDAVLDPGFSTNFTERMLYSSFDATAQLVDAMQVVLAARVGAGKYSLGLDPPVFALLAQLVLTCANGSTVTLATDASWQQASSPITYENIYQGEIYDARLEQPQWSTTGGSSWQPVRVIPKPVPGVLSPQLQPPVKAIREISPATVRLMTAAGSLWRFDLGENIAGLAKLRLYPAVSSGTTVTMQFGEIILPDGSLSNPFTQVDQYTFSGLETSGSWWMPTFVYHGYRIVDVTGLPEHVDCSAAAADCLRGVVMHTAVQATGEVSFPGVSERATMPGQLQRTRVADTLDAVHQAVLRTQLANLVSVPTDCPHREKRGWMGDGQWTAEEASLNFDMHAMYTNWVQAMMDMQEQGCVPTDVDFTLEPPYGTCCSRTQNPLHPTIFQCSPYSNSSDTYGSVPDMVPMLWGNGGSRGWPGSPVWGTAIVVIPDVLRTRYGDRAFLSVAYPNLKRYMDFLKRQARYGPGGILPQFGLLGDWLSLDPMCPGGNDECLTHPGWTSGNPTSSFYYLLCVEAMAELAAELGLVADATKYTIEFAAGLTEYHSLFFNRTAGNYGPQQTANTLPLYLGAVPPALSAQVTTALVDSIKAFGSISTGGVGTRWILQALTAANRTAEALALASANTQPSWGYFATSSPGTLWENWEQSSGSFNHIMLGGGVDPWIYHQVLGIRPPSTRTTHLFGRLPSLVPRQYIEFGVEGVVVEQVQACSGSIAVPGGRAGISWAYLQTDADASVLQANVTVPFAHSSSWSAPRWVGGRSLHSIRLVGADLDSETSIWPAGTGLVGATVLGVTENEVVVSLQATAVYEFEAHYLGLSQLQ
jgi:alpha-L-rhamnosidase